MFWKRKKKSTPSESEQRQAGQENLTPAPPLMKKFFELFVKDGAYHRYQPFKGSPADIGYTELSPTERAEFLLFFAENPPFAQKGNETYGYNLRETYGLLLRRKAEFTPTQVIHLLAILKARKSGRFYQWPIGLIVSQLEKAVKREGLTDSELLSLKDMLTWPEWATRSYGTNLQKAQLKLAAIVGEDGPTPVFELGNTYLAEHIRNWTNGLSEKQLENWNRLFNSAASANGSKPTKKLQTALTTDIERLGKDEFRTAFQDWASWAGKTSNAFHYPEAEARHYYSRGQLHGTLQTMIKGLVWGMARFHDEKSLASIAALAEKCFERLPGIGPAAPALGNACIYTLSTSKGLSGVAHLSRLKLRVKQNNTQKLIQKKIDENAKRLGLKSAEIEEMAAPDFGLTQGLRDYPFKDYTLRLDARRIGEAKLAWIKPDGSAQKSVPSFIKESETLKKQLTAIRATAKNIKKASTAQRDRIDRLYTEDMSWTPEAHRKAYLNHGLVGPLARTLIWQLEINGDALPALFKNEKWEDVTGKTIHADITSLRLWHPVMSDIDTIMAWRDRFEILQIQQPLKQAYREVYILTDAEITTRVYSNRMAAHILKQHQLNALAAIRGWSYSLMGAYDDGRDNEIAQKPLPAYDLTAQFWIDEILDEADSFNDSGIWDFVATDQVRFVKADDTPVDLIDIPPIILSEILRDADLFVGVASVGNDPTWADRGGAPRTQQYWQSFAFGNLNETAKTRKAVLEKLLPRLKIRDIAKIEGRFLQVQGKRHLYNIHIGSGNIQIASRGDRYLCIVPGRGKNKSLDNLYLPFEGDRGLSIVLSKAFLLAEDDNITDTTILSQLR